MQLIDQTHFQFSPKIGLAVAVMVGFLVFAVALDLTWEQFRSVLRKPKAPAIGLAAQYVILPAVAFAVGMLVAKTPSVALGVLLVTCCPAGALSNYLTGGGQGECGDVGQHDGDLYTLQHCRDAAAVRVLGFAESRYQGHSPADRD